LLNGFAIYSTNPSFMYFSFDPATASAVRAIVGILKFGKTIRLSLL